MSEKNEWKTVPAEPTPEILAAASLAAWPVASAADMELARKAARIVLMSMDAAPGSTLESVAAAIATMAPAYRAMLAAAPCPTCNDQGAVGNILTAQPCPDCTPAPSAPGDAQDERQAFEAWAEDQGFVLDCDFFEVSGQYYDSDDTQLAYDIWRAARASAPAAGDALTLLDHPLLRDVLGYIEDAGPADVWGAAQSWMALRDAALAAQVPQQGEA